MIKKIKNKIPSTSPFPKDEQLRDITTVKFKLVFKII